MYSRTYLQFGHGYFCMGPQITYFYYNISAIKSFAIQEICGILTWCGSVAQLVEQRPEEPCVDGSSPPGATKP